MSDEDKKRYRTLQIGALEWVVWDSKSKHMWWRGSYPNWTPSLSCATKFTLKFLAERKSKRMNIEQEIRDGTFSG